jgi:molybdenum transport protein
MMLALSDHDLYSLLRDDVPSGDLTTNALAIGAHSGQIEFRARQPMTVACTEEATRMVELAGAEAKLVSGSGLAVPADTLLLRARGSAAALHTAWKASQILVEWASGIATATAAIVAAAGGVPVACTRKNAPGTKALSAKAVRAGGAALHRLGLSETLLIFAEHRLFLNEAPAETVARMKRGQPEKKIVVEVATPEEALIWAQAGADVLQLEKFTPAQVAQCAQWRTVTADFSHVLLAAAGGVRADNAAAYVAAGADLLVTSAPYSAPPRDVQVVFSKLP